MKYVICRNCKKLIEEQVESEVKFGSTILTYTCPECGNTRTVSVNHTHYGDDAIK
jgi:RNase P subunit RPR2